MAAAIFDILKQKFGSSLQISSIQKLGRELQNIEGLKSQRTRFSTEYLVVRKIVFSSILLCLFLRESPVFCPCVALGGNRNTAYCHALSTFNQRVKCIRGRCGNKNRKHFRAIIIKVGANFSKGRRWKERWKVE